MKYPGIIGYAWNGSRETVKDLGCLAAAQEGL